MLLILGYYWLSMEKYYALHVVRYEKYQMHATLRLALYQELTTIVPPLSFSIREIDLVRVINPKSR